MEAIKCCGRFMELKAVGTRLTNWDLFFQCEKCGKVCMEKRDEFINTNELNTTLEVEED